MSVGEREMNNGLTERLVATKGEEGEEEERLCRKIWEETKKLWIVAGPAIFTRFSLLGVIIISQAFIGHIGSTELAAFALVSTVLTRFVIGILIGVGSGLETLCGQAFGARQYHMLGIYLQRSWIVLLVCCVLLLPIYIFAKPLLLILGQDEKVAEVAGIMSLWFIPVIFAYAFSFSFQTYLQAQSKNVIITYMAAITLCLHVFLSWLLSMKLKWGVPGAMVSVILAHWLPNFGQMGFVFCGRCPETWKGFTMLAFKDLWPVVKLSISSGVMLCLEAWYTTILILLTGHMKDAETAVDALSICLNIIGWALMISLGFLAAASVRVSNELGRGRAKATKFSIIVAVANSLSIGLVLFTLFMIFSGKISYVFTEDTSVSTIVRYLSPLLCLTILLNSVQPTLSGVAVGAGWQSVVAYVNLICYYLVGIPIGVVLGYVINLQVEGIWIGMLLGIAVQTLVLIYLTWRTDWDKQVALASARVNRWFVPSPDERNSLLTDHLT